jgi:hypothetical protein
MSVMHIIVMAWFLLLSGCGSTIHYAKDGGTQADLDRDRITCSTPEFGVGSLPPSRAQGERCLQEKGWRVVTPPDTSSARP